METLAEAGIDAVILFPLAGPTTERAWIQAAQEAGLDVIVGAQMTHENSLKRKRLHLREVRFNGSSVSQRPPASSITSCPATIPARLQHPHIPGHGRARACFYAPGFVAQGGEISAAGEAAGRRWHAIVGRAIYEASDIRVCREPLARAAVAMSSVNEALTLIVSASGHVRQRDLDGGLGAALHRASREQLVDVENAVVRFDFSEAGLRSAWSALVWLSRC